MYIFALAATGQGISGGDRIFIEFTRRWSKKYPITIYLWKEGYEMCKRQNLGTSNIEYRVSSMKPWKNFGFLINYFARIFEGIRIGLTLNLENSDSTTVYSASEFWMDSLPAFILKLRYKKIKWVAAWFQTAPKPWIGYTEGERQDKYNLAAFPYWLMQFPIKPIIRLLADFVLVNNEEEKIQFSRQNTKNKVMVVLGAVDLKKIKKWILQNRGGNLPKVYDGVFQGRFHPQKGVLELIDIWRLVVDKKSNAKLIMIGDGSLMEKVRDKVKKGKLEKNIILTGYLFDGDEKYKIFAQSKIVLHPAFYDSGGMASQEAMAFGLPAVGFNLKSFKSYYPKGMIKVKPGDLNSFANIILGLLNDEIKRKIIGRDALNMINKDWSWDKRANDVLKNI